ncbi:MAG: type 1 fimbrial protein subunit FimI [Yokenella regensburgei]|uniref:Fimbrial protein n=1 Tax=Yokenella regensburgei TaxID=158877 RepID=A0AB38FSI8_9ENTR|nr:type 1 fimbrial protein subunit FimI [Yokenella regensburgei]EHM48337.1 fimbrial protein [Yokenella regensburgei ATCC 43003]KAF1366847.1 fimbrial protein [Yokenella regensburgei]MDQ4431246.1 type 1 fimbrial protein subunit FimI [Yokenella regensburgei]MDR3103944.1 type 1 fimbrial protein subunit FimI [Yokenella regensburgei]RKR53166.1 fimbrial protein [Yokenella regensburgei]
MIRKFCWIGVFCLVAIPASAHRVVVDGGSVHMRGQLVNGACAVSPESENMRIDMGQYRTNSFSGVGNFSTVTVPFSIRLVDCHTDVSRLVGVAFQGLTPAEDPQVFVASTRVGGAQSDSGLGLGLFDQRQQLIEPNAPPLNYEPINSSEMTLHFSARYRVISLPLIPGNIHSDVWFTLVYP